LRFPIVLLTLAALAVPAGAGATAPSFLPAVEESLAAKKSAKRICGARLLSDNRRGIERSAYRAPMSGFVNVRLSGARRGDWDLAVFDRRTKRMLASSQAFGSRELAQTWVGSGQRLAILGGRRRGSGRAARLSIQFVDVKPPKDVGIPQLLRVEAANGAAVHRLEGLGLDVTHQIHDGHADVIATGAKQRTALAKAGFKFETVIADMNQHLADSSRADLAFTRRVGKSGIPSGRTTYRSLVAYQEEMRSLVETHPSRVRPVTLPQQTTQGRPIQGVEIASNVNAAEDGRPTWFVVALHHAREWPSAEIAMELAYTLAQDYGSDPRVTALVDRARIVIVPLINVDSFVFTQQAISPADIFWYGGTPAQPIADTRFPNGTPQFSGDDIGAAVFTGEQAVGAQAYRRKTCSGAFPAGSPCEIQWGTDPNRNYAEGWGGVGASSSPHDLTYRGPSPWSEPETQAVHEFSQQRQVTNIITIHNVAALMLRPPGRKSDGLAPDEARMKEIGDAMADATGYRSQYGWQLYDTSGTTEDWNYAAQGAFGYTIEVGPGGTQADTPENYDPDSSFHMPYERGVVREWEGWGPNAGQGLREALLIAGESAINPADHSVIEGTAPAGRVLRVRKEFQTETQPVCTATVSFPVRFLNPPLSEVTSDKCIAPGARIAIPDHLETTMTVPSSGTFTWHVNPSTRPFKRHPQVAGGGETVLSSEEFRQQQGEQTEPYVKDRDEVPDEDFGSPLPDVEAPGSLDDPEPRHYVERAFTVTPDDADRINVKLDWPNATHEDYDLYLWRRTDSGGLEPVGEGTDTGTSANGPPDAEKIVVDDPQPGEYVVRVVNYAAQSTDWTLTVERVDVAEPQVLDVRENWTLTCESADGGTVYETHQVFVDRGQRVALSLPCGATTTPPKKDKKPKPPRNPNG
jgi:hypothetical protein